MTITQLEYAVAVATYKSFIAAAEKCFVTQPTLSMQIQKLEDELGVILFDRSKHPISITEIGALVIEQARQALAQTSKIYEVIGQEQNQMTGMFRLAVIPTVAPYIVPQLLNRMAGKHPGLTLRLIEAETAQIIKMLQNGELDAGLVSTPLEQLSIREYPLFYESLVGYFAPGDPALAHREIQPKDIRIEELLLLREGNCLRNQVLDLCSDQVEKLQQNRPYRYESGNVETLIRVVDTVGGLTVLPELATYEFSEEQKERIRYFGGEEPVREISLVTSHYFVRNSVLQSLMDEILSLVPEKTKVKKQNRKIPRIQSAKLLQ